MSQELNSETVKELNGYRLDKGFFPMVQYTVVSPYEEDEEFVTRSWNAVLNLLKEDTVFIRVLNSKFNGDLDNAKKCAQSIGYRIFENPVNKESL